VAEESRAPTEGKMIEPTRDSVCEGCGAPLDGARTDDIPRLCAACDGIVAARARRQPRHARRSGAAERRAIAEPRACPYCLRQFAGPNLVRHLRDVHHATMSLVRDGVTWPTQPHNDP
jgi:hypothetical protein